MSGILVGPARLPVLLCRKPCSPLPSASKMDSHSGSSAFPVIIPHALQPCLLLTELPSCGLACGGSGGVRQSPRLPRPRAPPQAPQVAGRPPAPQAQAALCLAWGRGAAPGPRSFLASAKPSRLSAHCAHCLRCSTPAVLTWSRLPGLPQPRCQCLREGGGLSGAEDPSTTTGVEGALMPSPTLNVGLALTQSGSSHSSRVMGEQALRKCPLTIY